MAMPQRPVGLDMNLSQPNVRPVPPPPQSIIILFRLIMLDYFFTASGHASRAMAMPQRPVGLDMNLSQPNVRPVPPPPQSIIILFRLIAISEKFFVNTHILF